MREQVERKEAIPILGKHPFNPQKIAKKAIEEVIPKQILNTPVKMSPVAIKKRGFERSENIPLKNLLIP